MRDEFDKPTILVLQVRGLNAFLASVPALRAIAEAFPDCHRKLVGPGNLRSLVELIPWPGFNPAFDLVSHPALVPLPRSLERPSLAINLHGPGPQSNAILRRIHPRRLLAYEAPLWERGPVWDPNASELSRWCTLLLEAGIEVDRSRTRIWRPHAIEQARGATVLHPGSDGDGRPALDVDSSAWAEVARAEIDAGRKVLITGRDDHAIPAAAIAERASLPADAVLAGRTDVTNLARTIAGASRVITVDGGIAPLAAALGTPTLTVYHPRFQSRLGTPRSGNRHRSVLLDGEGANGAASADGALSELLLAELRRLPKRRLDSNGAPAVEAARPAVAEGFPV
jgi:hypothetical protein